MINHYFNDFFLLALFQILVTFRGFRIFIQNILHILHEVLIINKDFLQIRWTFLRQRFFILHFFYNFCIRQYSGKKFPGQLFGELRLKRCWCFFFIQMEITHHTFCNCVGNSSDLMSLGSVMFFHKNALGWEGKDSEDS